MSIPDSYPPAESAERLSGLVERVTFHDPESGFCVLRLKVRGERDLVTLVGHAPAVTPGEYASASGQWVADREHGRQFKAAFVGIAPPHTLEGIERYLGSGMVKGIGPVYAGRLAAAFGTGVFDVIERAPARLKEVDGIGEKRATRIASGWADQKVIREIMVFLHAHGVSTSRAVRIFRTYGADAVAVVRDDPYRLARDVRGIGFVSADTIARRVGIAKDSPLRARAGVAHALAEASRAGHCGLPRDELVPFAAKLLDVDPARIETAVADEVDGGALVADAVDGRPCVFLAVLHRAEASIAARIARLAAAGRGLPAIDAERAIPWVERRLSIALAESQKAALRVAVAAKVLVVTGGPGVGKTTLVRSILAILGAKGVRPLLAAPTGRAAKRLAEATGIEAKTIHRLLEIDPASGGFRRDAATPLDGDLLVVDECSMVDVPLANQLLRAVDPRTSVIFVGDVDQLPSVGPGQFLADLIDSGRVPVVRLTEVFRQAAASRIVRAAHEIRSGAFPSFAARGEASDFHFVEADDPEAIVRTVVELVARRLPAKYAFDPVREIQVLCPMNRGTAGARAMNVALQAALNPPGAASIERFGHAWSPGDKVMQTENDYDREVYNGDVGVVAAFDAEEEELAVDFDGRIVRYPYGELDALVPCYATTIHKSQGSEYPAVVIPLAMQHYPMLKRNLVYTGVTRGRRLVVLVGQKKALALAVKGPRTRTGRRWSKLRERLQAVGP